MRMIESEAEAERGLKGRDFVFNSFINLLMMFNDSLFQVTQYQAVRYYTIPLCPCNERRLGESDHCKYVGTLPNMETHHVNLFVV